MDENKKKILEHINRLEQYSRKPENKWLLDELQRRFGQGEGQTDSMMLLKKIEQYLSLDYSFQQIAMVAGYEYVEVQHLKEKLVEDWREMLRYRYGIATRPISYVDFCSHAHFQSEGIINYFHFKINNGACDVNWINNNIDGYVSRHANFTMDHVPEETRRRQTTLDDINYNTKKIVLFNLIENQNPNRSFNHILYPLNAIQKIRNTESVHRSPAPIVSNRTYSFEAIEFAVSELNTIVKGMIV